MPPRARRTQEERSAETRRKLLKATLDCLVDLGYARTTTTDVADRAGVSRGAQLHHFPTKARLVTAAVAHLFEKREQEFRRAMVALPLGHARAAAAIDHLWSTVTGRSFLAWLELTVAARSDRELARATRTLARRTQENIERAFRDLFPEPKPANPLHALAPKFVFAVLQGLALDEIGVKDTRGRVGVLEALKRLAPLFVQGGAA